MNKNINVGYIKDFIIESELLSESKIKKIEITMFEKNMDFLDALIDNNFLDQSTLSEISANIMGVPYINLEEKIITLDVFKNIPELISQAHNLVSFKKDSQSISVAFYQAKDLEILEQYISKDIDIKLFFADKKSIEDKNKKYAQLNNEENFFRINRNAGRILSMDTFGIKSENDLPRHFRNDIANDLYTEKFVTGIMEYAVLSQANFIFFNLSDVNEIEISFKIGERNYPVMDIDRNIMFSLSTHIKKKLDINIFEKFIIKQGSCTQNIAGEMINLFVTFTQTDFGETITLQIEKDKKFMTDTSLLSKAQKEILISKQKKDSGFFILSGKEESGKSTTLYNFLEFDVAKHKDIYSLEHTIKHNLSYTKQISLSEKTNIIPIVNKVSGKHADVIAVEKISKALFPMLFNYVSTSKKVFLSYDKKITDLLDMLLEMNFDKGQIVKNFSLFIEHVKFTKLDADNTKQYFLNKEEIEILKSFIAEKEIQIILQEEGLIEESKKSLQKIAFYTRKKISKKP